MQDNTDTTHDHSHHAHAPAAPKRPPEGDQTLIAYTCPMHPQVRQMGPGTCPICGMALEPVLATGEQGESPELRDMTKRFWIGTALTAPVFALEMGGHLFNITTSSHSRPRTGCSCCWQHPSSSERDGRSSCVPWHRSRTEV